MGIGVESWTLTPLGGFWPWSHALDGLVLVLDEETQDTYRRCIRVPVLLVQLYILADYMHLLVDQSMKDDMSKHDRYGQRLTEQSILLSIMPSGSLCIGTRDHDRRLPINHDNPTFSSRPSPSKAWWTHSIHGELHHSTALIGRSTLGPSSISSTPSQDTIQLSATPIIQGTSSAYFRQHLVGS